MVDNMQDFSKKYLHVDCTNFLQNLEKHLHCLVMIALWNSTVLSNMSIFFLRSSRMIKDFLFGPRMKKGKKREIFQNKLIRIVWNMYAKKPKNKHCH